MRDTGRSGLTVLLRSSLLVALLVVPSVASAATTASGTVLGPAGVTPVPGAYVNFYNLVTGTTYQSEMTDANGTFLVTGMQEGRYDVAVETDRGLWLVMRPVELGGGEERSMSFALRERTYWEGAGDVPPRSTPLGTNIVGTAVILEDDEEEVVTPMGKKKKVGIATAIGAGILAIALIADDSSSSDASPFTP